MAFISIGLFLDLFVNSDAPTRVTRRRPNAASEDRLPTAALWRVTDSIIRAMTRAGFPTKWENDCIKSVTWQGHCPWPIREIPIPEAVNSLSMLEVRGYEESFVSSNKKKDVPRASILTHDPVYFLSFVRLSSLWRFTHRQYIPRLV